MMSKSERDNRANQLNPNNPEYKGDAYVPTKADLDNRSEQLDPQNPKYASSRKGN